MTAAIVFLRATLIAGCVGIALWADVWFGLAALSLIIVKPILIDRPAPADASPAGRWILWGAWLCSLGVHAGFWRMRDGALIVDEYYAVFAWLVAAILLAPCGRLRDLPSRGWRALAMAWAFSGLAVWLGASYRLNVPRLFYCGLLAGLLLLVVCRLLFRWRAIGVQLLNTLMLLTVALPVADFFLRPAVSEKPLAPDGKYYLYEVAKKDPAGYVRWCAACDAESVRLKRAIFMADPAGILPFRPKPGSIGSFLQSRITINHLGFRGREIPFDKGNAYRIVALGESTTFGATLEATDKPWPELLERMIVDRLKPSRPIEVINAGIPAYSIEENLHRLATDILPLKPDMIISYHGYNGFYLIDRALPLTYVKEPPAYEPRPLKLLADCEYRWKMFLYRRREFVKLPLHPPAFADPMLTEYAADYRHLIRSARTNHIRLVLASYSMAVNQQSDPDIVEFYRRRAPTIFWSIQANDVHSAIVRQLAEQNPEVCYIDTRPHLDGHHDEFIDLMHFTQDGRQQLAEIFFVGIKGILEEELAGATAVRTATNH